MYEDIESMISTVGIIKNDSMIYCTQVFHNINGDDNWAECFNAPNVDLPTGYYFGFSAATGDLAGLSVHLLVLGVHNHHTCLDNHDIISVKVYDIDSEDDAADKEKKEVI